MIKTDTVARFSLIFAQQVHFSENKFSSREFLSKLAEATHCWRSQSLSNSRRLHIVTTATHCNTLQHTAIHCNTLQYTAPYTARSVAKESYKEEGSLSTQSEQFRATTHCCYCSTVQHTATRCNTLQHAATHCNMLLPVLLGLLQKRLTLFQTVWTIQEDYTLLLWDGYGE